MAADNEVLNPARGGIINRIRQWFQGRDKEVQADKDTLAGIAAAAGTLDNLADAFSKPSPTLEAVYLDMRTMDDSMVEVERSLDILSEDSMAPVPEQRIPFRIVFDKPSPKLDELAEGLLARLGWQSFLVEIAREVLVMGNEFRQIGINPNFEVVDLMYLAPETMRVQTDAHRQLLRDGGKDDDPEGWAYVQYVQGNFTAGYYPWEIVHSKRAVKGGSLYGTPLFHAARWPWRKLVAMEDALVLNWLTRAFARLLFQLDVTGKSDREAQAFIDDFRSSLEVSRVGRARYGDMGMALVRDIYLGKGYHELMGGVHQGLADVKVLDTSGSVFTDTQALEHFRSKILMASGVPRAYLGLEEMINAKATLAMEDRQYARTLQSIQRVVGNSVAFALTLQMILHDIPPYENLFSVIWYNPSRADQVDDSMAQQRYAQAAETLKNLGVVDAEYIASRYVGMSPRQWADVMARVQSQADMLPKGDDEE